MQKRLRAIEKLIYKIHFNKTPMKPNYGFPHQFLCQKSWIRLIHLFCCVVETRYQYLNEKQIQWSNLIALNPLASSKLQQMAKGIEKLKCARMRSKSQCYWFNNEILSKNYLGRQELERLHRLHPSEWSPEQPGLSSLLTCFEQEVGLRTPPWFLAARIILWALFNFFFLGHTQLPHFSLTLQSQVLQKYFKKALQVWPEIVMYQHHSWRFTQSFQNLEIKSPKLTMLLN